MSGHDSGTGLTNRFGGWIASMRNRVGDWTTEQRLRVRTTGSQHVPAHDAVAYSTFAYAGINRVLDRLDLGPDDIFVDVGCGKGRVVCAAAVRGVRQVIGIDVDPELCRAARENAQRLRPRHAPIEIIHRNATDFDYRNGTAIFLFNPFNRGTFSAVLDAIVNTPGPSVAVRLAYVHPRFDHAIAETGHFERYDHWPFRQASRLKFAVSFWRTV